MELLPLCVKQVSSPSSERRTLIALLFGSLSPRLDLGTQAHVLLTQLHRLAEDRIEQVCVCVRERERVLRVGRDLDDYPAPGWVD